MENLTLRQHQKLAKLFENERVRLKRLWDDWAIDPAYRARIDQEMVANFELAKIILALPHDTSHPVVDDPGAGGIPNEYGGQTLAGNP